VNGFVGNAPVLSFGLCANNIFSAMVGNVCQCFAFSHLFIPIQNFFLCVYCPVNVTPLFSVGGGSSASTTQNTPLKIQSFPIVPNRSQVPGMNGKDRVRDEYFIHPNRSQLKYVGNPWDGTNGITFSGLLLDLTFGVIIPNRSQNWNGRFFSNLLVLLTFLGAVLCQPIASRVHALTGK